MATYTTAKYKESASKNATAGLNFKIVEHTLTSALAAGTSDTLKVLKLPLGARILNNLCFVASKDDPDSGNNATVALKLTDGTTTKTIIDTGNLQAADTALTGTVNQLITNDLFVTDNSSYYVYLEAVANDVDSGADLVFGIAWLNDGN